jgi:hypothetical protein
VLLNLVSHVWGRYVCIANAIPETSESEILILASYVFEDVSYFVVRRVYLETGDGMELFRTVDDHGDNWLSEQLTVTPDDEGAFQLWITVLTQTSSDPKGAITSKKGTSVIM